MKHPEAFFVPSKSYGFNNLVAVCFRSTPTTKINVLEKFSGKNKKTRNVFLSETFFLDKLKKKLLFLKRLFYFLKKIHFFIILNKDIFH